MKYFKVVYDKDYDTVDCKSKRILLRAYQKMGINYLINNDGNPFILVEGDENGVIREVFSGAILNKVDTFIPISEFDFCIIMENFSNIERLLCTSILSNLFLGINYDLGFEITSIEELALDRAIQLRAYFHGDTSINPYDEEYSSSYTLSKVHNYNEESHHRCK